MRPLIVLTNTREPVKWLNEKQAADRKEVELKRVSNGFNLPRDQIYALQCYSSDNDQLSA